MLVQAEFYCDDDGGDGDDDNYDDDDGDDEGHEEWLHFIGHQLLIRWHRYLELDPCACLSPLPVNWDLDNYHSVSWVVWGISMCETHYNVGAQ